MIHKSFLKLIVLFTLGALSITAFSQNTPPASAAPNAAKTFLVDSTADLPDATPGDGKCKSAGGKCTLRAAVQEANALAGPNTILVPAGEYILTSPGYVSITDDLTLRGQGIQETVINGNAAHRILKIAEPNHAVNVTIEQMTLRNGKTGQFDSDGAAISNEGTLTLDHVLITDNHGKSGGGISNSKTLHMRFSTLHGNSAARGGGLSNWADATADIVGSTISQNDATYGGGIDNYGGTLFIVNSTIANNQASIDGGGMYNLMQAGKANYLDLRSVTVSRNRADSDTNGTGGGGGIFTAAGTTTVLFDTIVAQNYDMSTELNPALLYHDCSGALTEGDYGYNLLGSPNGCSGLTNGQKGDKVGTSGTPLQAKLNELANNGGPTQTLLPLNDSPAVDAGDPGNCANDTNGVDQRRYARVVGNKCDMGAVEVGANCAGKPGASVRFTPTEGAKTKKTTLALKWLRSDCADTYQIMVRRDAKNGPKAAAQKNLTDSIFIASNLLKGHTYFWQVKACNSNGCAKSGWFTFTVQ